MAYAAGLVPVGLSRLNGEDTLAVQSLRLSAECSLPYSAKSLVRGPALDVSSNKYPLIDYPLIDAVVVWPTEFRLRKYNPNLG